MFLVRVLSGYEERRIRAYRLQLQDRIEKARSKKVELRKISERAILSEVRRTVEEMQALNRRLEETEAVIEEYLRPIDKNAHMIMNMQLDREERQVKEMIKAIQEQAMHHKEMALRQAAELNRADPRYQVQNNTASPQQEQAN